MGIRTGSEVLASFRDDREIWIDGERVKDVTTDPRFRGAAQAMADLYDMQHEPELVERMTFVSPKTDDNVSLSYIEPKSIADLERRRVMVKTWMDATCGMFGRSPDFMNIHVTGFASAASEFAKGGDAYGRNIRGYYEHARENDVSMTHTLVNPQVDRSVPVHEQSKDLAAKIVKETDSGVVIRGARMVATLAAYANDLMVMPSNYLQNEEAAKPYAFGFNVPVNTKGLKIVCRPTAVHLNPASEMDYPLSSRFDETDSMIIFDDVLVPWERVFIYRNVEMCNGLYHRTQAMNQIMHQFCTKNLAKAEFMMGLAFALVRTTKIDVHQHVQGMLSELINFTEFVRACIRAAEADAKPTPFGTVAPDAMPLWTVRMMFPKMFVRMCEIVQLMGAGGLVGVPSYAEMKGDLQADVEKYFQAANADSASRIKLFRLAYDAAVSSFSGRQQLYERFYTGDPVRLAGQHYNFYAKDAYIDRIWGMLDNLEARLDAATAQAAPA